MDSFSWTDGIRATVGACLPCFASTQRGRPSDDATQSENEGRTSRTRQSHYDELEGLLGDVDDTDADAETMSLHSNVGDGRSRRKKNRKRRGPAKTIRLFGFNLFGRPPVQLSESEHEDDGDPDLAARRRGIGRLRAAHSSSSISAFDSDASPLDASLIAQLSAEDAAARAAHEAMLHAAEEQRRREEREEKEERRRRRRERRELKKVAQGLARGVTKSGDPEDFEGFQGSGQLRSSLGTDPAASVAPPLVAPTMHADEFGPFVAGTKPFSSADDELPDGETDFGGEAYARTARSRGSDSSRSHTHSQTSTSQTQSNVSSHHAHNYNQHYGSPLSSPSVFNPGIGLQPSPNMTSPFPGAPSPLNLMGVPRRNKHSKRSSTSQSTGKKSSSSPTSPSASLPSFDSVPTTFAPAEPHIVEHDSESGVDASVPPLSPGAPPFSFEKGLQGAAKFPSAGFGGVRRTNSSGSGVFLARRGDD